MTEHDIGQRLSGIEAKMEAHMANDEKTFDRMSKMHDEHYKRAQNQGEVIATMLNEIKSTREFVGNFRRFYVGIISMVIGCLVTWIFTLLRTH